MVPSSTLGGINIPQDRNTLQELRLFIEARLESTDYPEYYGFSYVLKAYVQNDALHYAQVVTELCRCLHEALHSQQS